MNKEFFVALQLLEREKGIPQEYMIEKIEAGLVSAFKKEYGSNTNVRVNIDPVEEDVRVYQQKEVVEVVEDPGTQISLADAKAISKRNTLGKIVEFEVKPKNFRRLSAGIAKNVIVQGIREGEHKAMQEAYESKREEIITAVVDKVDYVTGAVVLITENGRAVLPRSEQIPGESFRVGDRIKVYIQEVNREMRGPIVTLSRVHPGFVRRMFELEIPEITDGVVMIKNVSREAGSRSKIAVYSRDENVDAVGACIGSHGMRIESILSELGGEKVDIVKYSEVPEEFVAAALSPATVLDAEMDGERFCRVTVAPEQLSLAIGKEGQNVRLAVRLTGIKIDITAEGLEKSR
ncbi:MAG: transcription termination/antitermination protein NusA [Clostridia bacterium]|nr:transcription termination/antitermination protein NusA [Clostridia bacterium]